LKHENLPICSLPLLCLHDAFIARERTHGTDPHWELSEGSCVEIHSQKQKSIPAHKFKKVIWDYISADWDVAHLNLLFPLGWLFDNSKPTYFYFQWVDSEDPGQEDHRSLCPWTENWIETLIAKQ
jgi:hypothetical protein